MSAGAMAKVCAQSPDVETSGSPKKHLRCLSGRRGRLSSELFTPERGDFGQTGVSTPGGQNRRNRIMDAPENAKARYSIHHRVELWAFVGRNATRNSELETFPYPTGLTERLSAPRVPTSIVKPALPVRNRVPESVAVSRTSSPIVPVIVSPFASIVIGYASNTFQANGVSASTVWLSSILIRRAV